MHNCTTNHSLRSATLCVSALKAHGILALHSHDRLWTCQLASVDFGTVTATLRGEEYADAVVVTLSSATESRQARIVLESTPCQLGGERWWLLCHGCERRTMHLYARFEGPAFLCRTCAGIPYDTLTATRLDRIRIARDKVARKLGFDETSRLPPFGFPTQPPRMRFDTYARLADEVWRLDLAALEASERWVTWMQGRFFPAGRTRANARRTAARRDAREQR